MIFETLYESSQRGELLLVDGGMCHWHLRRDGQLTIREIIATIPGAGKRMLRRLFWKPGVASLFAKCPSELPSNDWYLKRGFTLEATEQTKTGRELKHYRMVVNTHQEIRNMDTIELIYCADGNHRLMETAIDAGFLPGIQAPGTAYCRPYFIDLHPNTPPAREVYMAALAKYRPRLATVKDWEHGRSKEEIFSWAEEAAQYAGTIIVIPKIPGTVHEIPEQFNGIPVRLGYSVYSEHGSTTVPLSEFGNRAVHLLGGSPEAQMRLSRMLNVKSADGNYAQKLATKYCQYFSTSQGNAFKNQRWPTLRETDGGWDHDAPYEAFRRSCTTIIKAWRDTLALPPLELPPEQPSLFQEIACFI